MPAMKRHAFTLLELLIVVAIIAALVGVAMPYYQNYMRDTKMAKAKHELDIIKEALIKFNTFEDRRFQGRDLNALLGKYLQQLNTDPWGRAFELDPDKGQVWSLGPDHLDPRDDIIVDFMPPLALQRALWIDGNHDMHVGTGDLLRLEFSRVMIGSLSVSVGKWPDDTKDLMFSQEVQVTHFTPATTTITSWTEFLLPINGTDTFFPGSSTVRVASGNLNLKDLANRTANGTRGQFPGLDVVIQAQ